MLVAYVRCRPAAGDPSRWVATDCLDAEVLVEAEAVAAGPRTHYLAVVVTEPMGGYGWCHFDDGQAGWFDYHTTPRRSPYESTIGL